MASPSSSTHIPPPSRMRARLVSSSPSLFDTTLVNHATKDTSYAVFTDPENRTTVITRPHAERVAWIQWPTSKDVHPAVLFQGDVVPVDAGEMLFSSGMLGHKWKFRVPGYAETFKWKKVTGGWKCFACNTRTLIAFLHLLESGPILDLLNHDLCGSSCTLDPRVTPQQHLDDTIILTSLLLTSPPSGPTLYPTPTKSSSLSLSVSAAYKPSKSRTSSRSSHDSNPPMARSGTSRSQLGSPTAPSRIAFEIERDQLASSPYQPPLPPPSLRLRVPEEDDSSLFSRRPRQLSSPYIVYPYPYSYSDDDFDTEAEEDDDDVDRTQVGDGSPPPSPTRSTSKMSSTSESVLDARMAWKAAESTKARRLEAHHCNHHHHTAAIAQAH